MLNSSQDETKKTRQVCIWIGTDSTQIPVRRYQPGNAVVSTHFQMRLGYVIRKMMLLLLLFFWKTNKRFGGSFFVFFHDISSTDVYIIFDCKIVQCFDFICTILCTYIYVKFWWQSTQHSKTSFHCSVFSDMVKIHQYHH